jgi:Tfp pilus assembly pilus retraction ATPase PilT
MDITNFHLQVDDYPMMRVHGELCQITKERRFDPATLNRLVAELVPMGIQSRFTNTR